MTGPPLGHGGHSYLPARRRVRVDPWRIAAAPVFQGWRIIRERFFYDGQCYIFEREPNGNNQMICEVRGVGAGLEKRNAKLLEDSLNGHALLVAENAALKEALVDCWFQVEVENALINSIEKATGEKPKVFGRFR